MKSAAVSYTANERCKTLSVPFIEKDYSFGTGMSDPVWEMATSASDFVLYPQGGTPLAKSRMALFRSARHLVIGFFFADPEELRTHLPPGYTSMWQGDLAELHFGNLEPDPWLLQLAVGIDGSRFDSSGSMDRWEVAVFSRPDGWGAELRLEPGLLPLTEGGVRFNLVRESLKRKERIVWSRVWRQYHEVPNFGELLFGSFADTAAFRTGKTVLAGMTREEFETARTRWEIPANEVIHGPYLTFPDRDSLCINFQTAGKVAAWAAYREKGSTGPFLRADGDGLIGILPCETMHFVKLTGLKPDTEYEYELFSLFPVTGEVVKHEARHTFRTLPAAEKPFSFFLFTDLHSDVDFLRKALLLPEAKQASCMISLGDNLSYAPGPEGIFAGVIDPLVETQRRFGQDKPLIFVRGNHEELGIYAAEYFRVMRHPGGRSWYTFLLGDVFFIALDSGDDSADSPERRIFSNTAMFEEERNFLQEVVSSAAYRNAPFRIALMHIPPLAGKWLLQRKMTEPLAQAGIRPDLMLCGHMHKHIWLEADDPAGLPFPILSVSHRDVVSCELKNDHIQLCVLTPRAEGRADVRQTIAIGKKRA